MSIDREKSLECLGCDFAIGPNWDAYVRVESPVEGWLHVACRAKYEAENGPVVCEEDAACDSTCNSNLYLGAGCDCGMQEERRKAETAEPAPIAQAKAFVSRAAARKGE